MVPTWSFSVISVKNNRMTAQSLGSVRDCIFLLKISVLNKIKTGI